MYTLESYKKPFWAENSGFITGRDALGVQNSSITTYGRLLPGMTNLTLRLRYYGFYMWILYEHRKLYGDDIRKFSPNDQHTFIRRAELILAFTMLKLHPAEQSVIGSDYTKLHMLEIDRLGYYDIKNGADKEKGKDFRVYWDFRSGALGQYYAGSLVALQLIINSENIFVIQEKGVELAKAYKDNISDAAATVFLKAIKTGKLTANDISELDDFAINGIKLNSPEWSYYTRLLIDNDGPSFKDNQENETALRNATLKLYLEYLPLRNVNDNDRGFIKYQYNLNKAETKNDASFGWYYYYLNEAFHFALESIFWSILTEISIKERNFDLYLDEITLFVGDELKTLYFDSDITIGKSINPRLGDTVTELEYLETFVKSDENYREALGHAFKLMLTIYGNHNHRLEEIIGFENKYMISNQNGRLSENLLRFVKDKINTDIAKFVKESIKSIINNHINSAYRKMGNGESNLLKFMIDDGIIYHVQTMQPTHTSPRIRAMENFMQDLSLVDSNKSVTADGQAVLKLLG